MATFSPTDAGMSGFRLAMANPRIVGIWGVVLAAVSLVVSALTIVTVGPSLAELQDPAVSADPETSLRLLGVVGPFYLGLMLFFLLYYGVVLGAVNRLVLRPGDRASAYLRLGGDEWRLILLMIIQAVLGGLAMTASLIPMIALIAGAAAGGSGALSAVGGVVGVLFAVALMAFLTVRFSLAASQTFDTGRLNVFGSWTLTRGRFWPLVGAYLLAFVLYLVVYLVFMVVMSLLAIALGGGLAGVTTLFQPNMSDIGAFFTPMMILYTVAGGFLSAIGMLILYGPAATVYRDLVKPQDVDVFD